MRLPNGDDAIIDERKLNDHIMQAKTEDENDYNFKNTATIRLGRRATTARTYGRSSRRRRHGRGTPATRRA